MKTRTYILIILLIIFTAGTSCESDENSRLSGINGKLINKPACKSHSKSTLSGLVTPDSILPFKTKRHC